MLIIPSIDIRNGCCVRLYQGNYDQMTIYDDDPIAVASRWQRAGASLLHIVDLDGARAGDFTIFDLVARLRSATQARLEVGGGIRTLERIEQLLDLGVDRVILGTVVITDPLMVMEALKRWKNQIVIELDARDGWVAIRGWREISPIAVHSLAAQLRTLGAQHFIYTDIGRDGTLCGPNLQSIREIQSIVQPGTLIASGGIGSMADIYELNAIDIEAVILGKSIYSGSVDLAFAIEQVEKRGVLKQY